MNFEPYGNPDAFLKMFCFPDTRFDGHNVATIFGKHGSLPLRSADPSGYRNHSPAIRYKSQYGLQVAALFRRNGDEVPGAGPRQYQILPLNSISIIYIKPPI